MQREEMISAEKEENQPKYESNIYTWYMYLHI